MLFRIRGGNGAGLADLGGSPGLLLGLPRLMSLVRCGGGDDEGGAPFLKGWCVILEGLSDVCTPGVQCVCPAYVCPLLDLLYCRKDVMSSPRRRRPEVLFSVGIHYQDVLSLSCPTYKEVQNIQNVPSISPGPVASPTLLQM